MNSMFSSYHLLVRRAGSDLQRTRDSSMLSMAQDHYGKNLVGFDQWPEALTEHLSQDQRGSTAAPEILLKGKFSGLTSGFPNQNLQAGGLGICLSKSSRGFW